MSTKGTGPSTTELLLGLDVGTSRTKAVLLDASGREVAGAVVATPFVTTGDRVEMAVDDLLGCVAEVLAGLGERRRHVVAAGVAGVAESGAPMDDQRRPLAPVIAWLDDRGGEAVGVLEREFGDGLALRTGQGATTKMTVAKLGWLLAHGVRDVDRWLGVPELALWALTGAEATEHSLASRTGCYDVTGHRWLPEVAGVLGFHTAVFAEVLAAGRVMGRVSVAGAAWSGLPAGIPVTIAGHDHLAGMAGGGVGPAELANSVGTAETIAGRAPTLPDMDAARAQRLAVSVSPGGTDWAVLVSAGRSGQVIEAAAAEWGMTPAELDARCDEAWAGVLAGLTGRAVDAYHRLAAVVGRRERMVVFGGGSASEPWLRAKAEAFDIPVVRSAVTSAVARGAAVHAGVAAGWWGSEDEAPTPPASGR
jgi:xylulokinase